LGFAWRGEGEDRTKVRIDRLSGEPV